MQYLCSGIESSAVADKSAIESARETAAMEVTETSFIHCLAYRLAACRYASKSTNVPK
jgi:hypothetical protein